MPDLRAAFRSRALSAHPDKGGTAALFQQVFVAFETLSDTRRRSHHDRDLGISAAPTSKRRYDGTEVVKSKRQHRDLRSTFKDIPHRAPLKSAKSKYACQGRTQKAFSARRGPRKQPLLSQLCTLLQRLGPERRRQVLVQQFSEVQRLALEEWMLTQRKENTSPKMMQQRRLCIAHQEHTPLKAIADSTESINMDAMSPREGLASEPVREILTEDFANRQSLGSSEFVEQARSTNLDKHALREECSTTIPGETSAHPKGTGRSKIRGITAERKSKQVWYSAIATIGMIIVTSRKVRDLALALEFLVVLTDLKSRVANVTRCSSADGFGLLEESFEKTLSVVSRDHQVDADRDLGLRFAISIPTKRWIGLNLQTPWFCLANLACCLRTWRQLRDARGQICRGRHNFYKCSPEESWSTWAKIRKAYIGSLDRVRQVEVAAKLQALEDAHRPQQQREFERWNRGAMAREERRQRLTLRVEESQQRREQRAMMAAEKASRQQSRRQKRQEKQMQRVVAAERHAECRIGKCLLRWERSLQHAQRATAIHHRKNQGHADVKCLGKRVEKQRLRTEQEDRAARWKRLRQHVRY